MYWNAQYTPTKKLNFVGRCPGVRGTPRKFTGSGAAPGVALECFLPYFFKKMYATVDSQLTVFRGLFAHGGRLNLQIQGRMQIFEKNALNRVLTLPDCRSRSQLSESGLRSQKGPLGVEL